MANETIFARNHYFKELNWRHKKPPFLLELTIYFYYFCESKFFLAKNLRGGFDENSPLFY